MSERQVVQMMLVEVSDEVRRIRREFNLTQADVDQLSAAIQHLQRVGSHAS